MSDVEAKLDRRRHLVDVLPPGTRGADEPFQNLAFVEEDRLRDADHGFILAHGSFMMKTRPPCRHAPPEFSIILPIPGAATLPSGRGWPIFPWPWTRYCRAGTSGCIRLGPFRRS